MSEENQVEIQEEVVSLSVNDLAIMVNVIDACSQRGAFKPAEMETVGSLYTKIVSFLQASGAIKPAESGAEGVDSEATEEISENEDNNDD